MTFRVITNCWAAEAYIERCLGSLRAQTVDDWTCTVTIDPCGDATYERALAAIGGDPRFDVQVNGERRWAMHNLVHGIARSGADADDVIVVLDGDDSFATPRALEIIRDTYRRYDCWLTYGSWIAEGSDADDPPHTRGAWPPYPDHTTDFRSGFWLGTAVRTFRKWLWDRIDDADLRDDDGRYFRICEDQACMMPMLEMATTRRARHIAEVLLIYNRANPNAVGRLMLAEMRATAGRIRARAPYRPIDDRPEERKESWLLERQLQGAPAAEAPATP